MNRVLCAAAIGVISAAISFAAEPAGSVTAKVLDGELKAVESEFVPLVEAMPADKFDFAPSEGEFKGVRTFKLQASHVAAVLLEVSATVLGDKAPDMGTDENGPASLKTKEDVVKYVKDAFAYGHKAMQSLTDKNALGW